MGDKGGARTDELKKFHVVDAGSSNMSSKMEKPARRVRRCWIWTKRAKRRARYSPGFCARVLCGFSARVNKCVASTASERHLENSAKLRTCARIFSQTWDCSKVRPTREASNRATRSREPRLNSVESGNIFVSFFTSLNSKSVIPRRGIRVHLHPLKTS